MTKYHCPVCGKPLEARKNIINYTAYQQEIAECGVKNNIVLTCWTRTCKVHGRTVSLAKLADPCSLAEWEAKQRYDIRTGKLIPKK